MKFCQKSTERRDLIERGAKVVVASVGANGFDASAETAEGKFNNRLRRSRSFEECRFKTKEQETEPLTDIEIARLAVKAGRGQERAQQDHHNCWQRQDQRLR